VSSAAHKLAVGVVQQCADKLEPYVQRLLTSVMLEGREAEVDLHEHYHDIIYEIYQCAPQMLLAVIPNFTQELVVCHILGHIYEQILLHSNISYTEKLLNAASYFFYFGVE
jgi:hypothetical protein